MALALNLLGFLTALGLRSVGISYERPTSIFAISLAWIFITSAGALFWIGPTTRSQSVWVAALWVGIISAPVGVASATNAEVFAGPLGIFGGMLSITLAIIAPYVAIAVVASGLFFRLQLQETAYKVGAILTALIVTICSGIVFAIVACAGQC